MSTTAYSGYSTSSRPREPKGLGRTKDTTRTPKRVNLYAVVLYYAQVCMNGDTSSIKAPNECSKKFAATVKGKSLTRENVLRIVFLFLEDFVGLYRKGVATQFTLICPPTFTSKKCRVSAARRLKLKISLLAFKGRGFLHVLVESSSCTQSRARGNSSLNPCLPCVWPTKYQNCMAWPVKTRKQCPQRGGLTIVNSLIWMTQKGG